MEQKNNSVLTITLTTIVVAILVGGGSWYFLNAKSQAEVKALNSKISQMQTQIDNLSKTKQSSAPVVTKGTEKKAVTSETNGSLPVASQENKSNEGDVFSLENLKNAYVTVHGKSYKLTDGKYAFDPAPANPGFPTYIALDEKNIVIDSGNSEQVSIVLKVTERRDGYTARYNLLEVMGNKGGKPQQISEVLPNKYGGSTINNIEFKSNLITVKMLVPEPADTQVEPTVSKTVSYKLTSDSKLIEQ